VFHDILFGTPNEVAVGASFEILLETLYGSHKFCKTIEIFHDNTPPSSKSRLVLFFAKFRDLKQLNIACLKSRNLALFEA
jgi:hypothetical protein